MGGRKTYFRRCRSRKRLRKEAGNRAAGVQAVNLLVRGPQVADLRDIGAHRLADADEKLGPVGAPVVVEVSPGLQFATESAGQDNRRRIAIV